MSRGKRIALIGGILVTSSLCIIGYIYGREFNVDIGLVHIDIYWRPAPVWLLSWLAFLLVVLLLWWQHRMRHKH